MTRQELNRRVLPPLLLIAGALLLVLGARLSAAGIAAYRAEVFMMHWAAAAEEPAVAAWQVAAAAAQRAVAAYPVENGDYLDRLGRVYDWRHFKARFSGGRNPEASTNAGEVAAGRQHAAEAFRKSIRARPMMPTTRLRLAGMKVKLLELDAEFHEQFAAGYRLGGLGPAGLDDLAEVGLVAWPSLSQGERRMAATAILRRIEAGDARATGYLNALAGTAQLAEICREKVEAGYRSLRLCKSHAGGQS